VAYLIMLKRVPLADEVGRDTARSDCSAVSTDVDAVEGSGDIFALPAARACLQADEAQ